MKPKSIMKAAVLRGIGDLRVEEVCTPEIGDEDILLRVEACAICGTDVKAYRYGYKTLKPPQITGHEISGTVAKNGKNVKRYEIGDRVCVVPIVSCGECYYCKKGMTHLCLEFMEKTEAFGFFYPGGFAEYMAVPGKAIKGGNLIRVPDNVSDEEASIAEPMGCALNGQMLAGVGKDDDVLIIGAGPMGCIHICVARALGAHKILVSEISQQRQELARQFGADYYINPEKQNLKETVLEATDGMGATVVIIAAGSRIAQESSLELTANRAHINLFGGLPKGDSAVSFDSNLIHYKELFIHGSSGSTASQVAMCIDFMREKKVDAKKIISKVIQLEKLPQMLEEVQKGNYLKVVVKP